MTRNEARNEVNYALDHLGDVSFAELENEALEADPAVLTLLSIAWAHVSPVTPEADVDASAMRSLRELIAHDDVDCDASSLKWLVDHGVRLAA